MKIIMRPPGEAFRRALSKHPLGDRIDPGAALRHLWDGPETMPTPVSSHDVSIPRTSGPSLMT